MAAIYFEKNVEGVIFPDGSKIVYANGKYMKEILSFLNKHKDYGVLISRNWYFENDLAFLKGCLHIKKLIITCSIESIDDLYSLVNLKYLDAEDLILENCSTLVNLHWLSCSYSKKMSNLPGTLKTLKIRKVKLSPEVFFGEFIPKHLENLEVIQGNLKSLTGIQKLENLKFLSLNYLSSLADVEDLSKVIALQKLEIESCKKACDLQVFSKLTEIQHLKLGKCGVISDVEFVSKLAHLLIFTFVETKVDSLDLSPLANHVSLTYAGFIGIKYNYSFEGLNEILGKNKQIDKPVGSLI